MELNPFLKTLTLLITFEQWMLEVWYLIWVFLVIRNSCGYHHFFTLWPWPWIWPIFENFNLAYNFWTERFYITWAFRVQTFGLVTIATFRIGHYRWHLCFTDTSCFNFPTEKNSIFFCGQHQLISNSSIKTIPCLV